MSIGIAPVVRAFSAALAQFSVASVVTIYIEWGVGSTWVDWLPLAMAAVALVLPLSYLLHSARVALGATKVASLILVVVLGAFAATTWVGQVRDGFSPWFLLREGFPNNLLLTMGLALLVINARFASISIGSGEMETPPSHSV